MKDGGSAFPQIVSCKDANGRYDTYSCGGMTLRDWFAGQALASLSVPPIRTNDLEWITSMSYSIADAMLAEREGE